MLKCSVWPVFWTSFRFDCFSVWPAFPALFSATAAFRSCYCSKVDLSKKAQFFLIWDKIAKPESGPNFKKEPFSTRSVKLSARLNESCLKAGFDCKLGSEWINCRYYLHFNPRKVKYKLLGSENLNRGTLAEINRHSKKKDEDGLRKYFENHEYV